mmetsp:Transcript_50819/g.133960  ORF Transcript_50819/g.133960 Transcript_50819/m.133960 type:complete len:175 (+) Transcript_50819:123-647(+)
MMRSADCARHWQPLTVKLAPPPFCEPKIECKIYLRFRETVIFALRPTVHWLVRTVGFVIATSVVFAPTTTSDAGQQQVTSWSSQARRDAPWDAGTARKLTVAVIAHAVFAGLRNQRIGCTDARTPVARLSLPVKTATATIMRARDAPLRRRLWQTLWNPTVPVSLPGFRQGNMC